jgi:hypothetical protein
MGICPQDWALSYRTVSKFPVDEGFEISASAVRGRWPTMSQSERLDLVSRVRSVKTGLDTCVGTPRVELRQTCSQLNCLTAGFIAR